MIRRIFVFTSGPFRQKLIIRLSTSTSSRAWFAMGCPWWLFQEAKWYTKLEFSVSLQEMGSLFLVNRLLNIFTNGSSNETRWVWACRGCYHGLDCHMLLDVGAGINHIQWGNIFLGCQKKLRINRAFKEKIITGWMHFPLQISAYSGFPNGPSRVFLDKFRAAMGLLAIAVSQARLTSSPPER